MEIFIAGAVLHYDIFTYAPIFRERFSAITNQGLLALNTKQQILDMNPAAESFLGVSLTEAFGNSPADIHSISPEFRDELHIPKKNTTSRHFSVAGLEPKWYQISSFWTDSRIGSDGASLILITDISATIILEQEIAKTKMELIKEIEKVRYEQRYWESFMVNPDPILLLRKTEIIKANLSARKKIWFDRRYHEQYQNYLIISRITAKSG